MPEMTSLERAFCRSAPWRWFAREAVLPWALQGRQLAGDVLEIGGGSGAMAAEILQKFPAVRLTVTDYDQAMLETARTRLSEFDERVTVRQADATQLPFPDDSFDTVVSFIMLHHVIDWEAAIAEAIRVLRSGGSLIGYDLLASWPMRLLHQAEGSRHRMMHMHELCQELRRLPTIGAVSRSLGGLTVRFALEKRGAGPSEPVAGSAARGAGG
jgi:ubiquinone/menaquinone biosynthesis C-methylase UbiE